MNIPFEIIDFHTHPFETVPQNICSHKECFPMSPAQTVRDMKALGMSHICGSVIQKVLPDTEMTQWDAIRISNDTALRLAEEMGGFYVPGYHVHPDYVQASCEEIERMSKKGVKLIGELVPYLHGWEDYSCAAFDEILDVAEQYNCIVSFHTMRDDNIDRMVQKHPNVKFVAAHPGEYNGFKRHMERMKMSKNYYLDLSGYGIFRHGMLRHGIDLFGAERFLFGSDYPTCNPAMYVGGVLLDDLITDAEKEAVFATSARNLLKECGVNI